MIGDLFDNPWKILIIAIVILVIFGSTKLPIAARSLGKSVRILKTELGRSHDDDEDEAAATTVTAQPPAPAQLQTSASPADPNAQSQIDALSKQLSDLQQSVAANKTDSAQA